VVLAKYDPESRGRTTFKRIGESLAERMSSDEDEGNFAPRGRGESKNAETEGASIGPLLVMWESALEKLKLLNYEADFCKPGHVSPFSRVHFVFPGANASHQFTDFMEVSAWLCDMISPDLYQKETYDDPNTVVNKLMLALRSVGFNGNFPAQKLKAANGEPVCAVLDFLTDQAMEAQKLRWKHPKHEENEAVEEEGDDLDDELEDGIDDEAEGGVDDDALFQEPVGTEVDEMSLDHSAHQILHAEVDPVAWKTELERVGPRLKAQLQLSSNEWRAHVDQTCGSQDKINKVLGDTHGDLRGLSKDVREELNKLSTKEKYINHQFMSISADYREVAQKLEELEKKSGESNERVSKLTNELTELTERMDDLKENFESKDSGIHDTSPLVRIKAALQQIKEECQAFDLRIGVVGHSLLAARVATTARRRIGAQQRRRNKHKKRQSDHYDDDDDQ